MTWESIGWVVGALVIAMAVVGFVRYHRWLQEIGRREDARRDEQNTGKSHEA